LVAIACFLPGRDKDLSAPPHTFVAVILCTCMWKVYWFAF